ncbi:hypothetical protein LCGC14_2086840 [marine sediment metagenome]|uniref:Uncharacterized protein n=1 Tax=marine sediment metagenome TaxID=412755 RepID=A0A0F9F1D6_9ZZZZ
MSTKIKNYNNVKKKSILLFSKVGKLIRKKPEHICKEQIQYLRKDA